MKKKTYEESIKRLEDIVQILENGDLPLEESMKLFEEGAKLSAYCETCLKNAEQTIVELTDETAGESQKEED